MNKQIFLDKISNSDKQFESCSKREFTLPVYDPKTHYLEITKSKYFKALTVLRHNIKMASDFYWSEIQGAYNVDLFMTTPSVSSPMGPGSDSEAVEIKFGNLNTYLVDSSQFGFEPILMGGIEKVYCYLPSMRGEDPDKRHLNQFFHCEAEILGPLVELTPQIEGYVKFLAETFLSMKNIVNLLSLDSQKTIGILEELVKKDTFQEIEFDDAVKLLKENNFDGMINETPHGKDITSKGELKIMELLDATLPVWIRNYDRDRVAFYQKPDVNNSNKVINADLIFPNIIESSFGGEIVGCGQRQDSYDEMLESLNRQSVGSETYEWYMNLRNQPNYKTTSGFGLGIERFITWALCRDDIKDAILYPRMKNILSHP
jgi:aspartyl/asparaginyl-tRNA synthetase